MALTVTNSCYSKSNVYINAKYTLYNEFHNTTGPTHLLVFSAQIMTIQIARMGPADTFQL